VIKKINMADKAKTIIAFCAQSQSDETFVVEVDDNLEYILTDADGHFIKVPQSIDLKTYLKAHKEANEGKITQEEIDAVKKAALDKI